MYTVRETNENEIIIKNSRFIGIIYNVTSEDEIKTILESLKDKYKDATHICYAYKLENKEKCIDDGEPTGTAGLPIMEVINKNELINTLIVVIRYFGGTLLGAGGLIRAYSKAAREVLKECDLNEYIKYNYYEIISDYDNLKLLNALTSDLGIETKKFDDKIIYKVKVKQDDDDLIERFKKTSIVLKKY